MASADPFNSVGGYTIGIPPVPVVDSAGNIVAANINSANMTLSGSAVINQNLTVSGNTLVSGNLTALNFYGNIHGNLVGNLTVPGIGNEVIFNNSNVAGGTQNFTYDLAQNLVTVSGNLIANTLTIGSGTNEFSTSRVFFAVTYSKNPGQVLSTVQANTVCSMDYTIIATDPVANTRQTSKLMATILNGDVGYYEYGTIDVPISSPGVADFQVVYDGTGNINLAVTPLANTVNYKIMITSYKE